VKIGRRKVKSEVKCWSRGSRLPSPSVTSLWPTFDVTNLSEVCPWLDGAVTAALNSLVDYVVCPAASHFAMPLRRVFVFKFFKGYFSFGRIRKMRELRKKGLSIMKIARILHRSPTTVNHYLKSNQRMSRNELSKM